ncbi:MAG TPA: cytochrome c-type biogenesis protein CcmH [Gemmatimonadales bacterium]
MSSTTRRDFLRLGLAGVVPVFRGQESQDTATARLWQPEMAGRPQGRVTDYQNDPFVIGIEKRLRCTCGCNLDIHTCRTTDFTCTYSPALHREVVAMIEKDMSAEEILAAFVDKYSETALMAPPKEGFNWAGYLVPGVVITMVGSALLWILLRRQTAVSPTGVAAAVGAPFGTGLSSEDAARLQEELGQLDG